MSLSGDKLPLRDHFLDSNIIIGNLIYWDVQYRCVIRYMRQEGCERCTSDHVYSECRDVLLRNRRVVPPFLNAVRDYEGSSNKEITETWVREYFWEYSDSHRLTDADRKTLYGFVDRNSYDIAGMLIGEMGRQEFISRIRNTIKIAINILDRDCNPGSKTICRYSTCRDYTTHYFNEFNNLQAVIPNSSDVRILIDSYYIKNKYLQRDVCFITMDKVHIVSNKDYIERTIAGIKIKHLT